MGLITIVDEYDGGLYIYYNGSYIYKEGGDLAAALKELGSEFIYTDDVATVQQLALEKSKKNSTPTPKAVVVLHAEYSFHNGEDTLGVYNNFEEIEQDMSNILQQGAQKEERFRCFFACEYQIGVLDQAQYRYKRYDKDGVFISEWSSEEFDEGALS